ncbi:MAG: hypothetical protein IJ716_15560 [Lachnospiraceae bacterium]|nr:hypothetical protein [Lachnospiraceae bacterium]
MWFQKKSSLVQAISIQAEKKGFVQYIHTTALPEFRGGRYGFADELQKIFLFAHAEHDQKEIAACFLDKIQAFTVRELLRFAEATRCFYAEEYNYASNWQAWRDALRNVRHKREDFPFLSDQEYLAMLCMGTLHSNGYYRQMCIEALRDCGSGRRLYSERYGIGLSLLIFYLLRVNDWVEEVRETAFAATLIEIEHADGINLLLLLPVLEKLNIGERRKKTQAEALEDLFTEGLKTKLTQAEFAGISKMEIQVRNSVYRLCLRKKFLLKEQMMFLLERERTAYGVRLIFAGVQKQFGFTDTELEKYLQSKNSELRLLALQEKYDRLQESWSGLESLLLDRAAKIRFWTRYILIRHEKKDILAFYKKELQKKASPICLLCIGEMGSEEEIALIEPFLFDSDIRLVKAALLAYAMIRKEEGTDLYWDFLTGEEMLLSHAAYKIIREYNVHYPEKDIYEAFIQHRDTEKELVFLTLLLQGDSWRRLEYLLELIDDPKLSKQLKCEILRACGQRNMYARMDQFSADRIRAVLQRKMEVLPRNLAEEILLDLKFAVR